MNCLDVWNAITLKEIKLRDFVKKMEFTHISNINGTIVCLIILVYFFEIIKILFNL